MSVVKAISMVGHRTVDAVWRIGMAARFFALILMYSGNGFRRFHLIIKELFSTGGDVAHYHHRGRIVRRDGAGAARL